MKHNLRNSFILLFATISLLVSSLYAGLTANAAIIMKFSDLSKQHPAYASVLYVTSMDYMNVYKDAKFKPKKAVTRADAAKFVGKANDLSGSAKLSNNISFEDVSYKTSNYSYIIALTAIDAFDSNDKFYPKSTITRQEAAKLFVNAFNLSIHTGKQYEDVTKENSYKDYISTAAFYNILKGSSSKKFYPKKKMNRADFAIALKKALDAKEELDATLSEEIDDESTNSPDNDVDETSSEDE